MTKQIVTTLNMTPAQWREFRKSGIGGSDAAAVCGLNKYKSAFQLWAEKTGNSTPEQEDTESEAMYWGKALEPVIREEFTKRTGLEVMTEKAAFRHIQHEFMLANIDGIVYSADNEFVFEAKTASAFKTAEWNADFVPFAYQLQVQHYMAALGVKGAYVAALIGGNNFRHCFVERDEEIIGMLIALEQQFWKCVEDNTPPPIDGSETAKDFLNVLYPKAAKSKVTDLSDDYLNLVAEFEYCQSEEKRYGELKDKASNELKQLMGDSEQARINERIISWKNVESERLDTKRLSAEQPEVYKQYLNKLNYRRFSIK